MTETAELARPSIVDKIKMRLEDKKLAAGPVSKEVIKQLTKIQFMLPKDAVAKEFREAKRHVIESLKTQDKEAKSENFWAFLTNLAKLFFYPPIIAFAGRTKTAVSEDIKRIKQSGKEWRTYLSKHAEGKKLMKHLATTPDTAHIHNVTIAIMSGTPPTE